MFLLPAVLAAVALPVSPALAGEDDGGDGSASLHVAKQTCVSGTRAKAWVTGREIETVRFYVDGELVKTVRQPGASGRYRLSMRCSHLDVGAHTARAVLAFTADSDTANRTLRFQITRVRRSSPRFTG